MTLRRNTRGGNTKLTSPLGSKADAESLLTSGEIWGSTDLPHLISLRLKTLRCNSNIVQSKLPWYKSCMVKLSDRVYSNELALE